MNTTKLLLIAVALTIIVVLAGCGGTQAQRTPGSAGRELTVVGWQDTTTGFYRPVLGYEKARSE
ncbi:MAG TPA: hypothetical protein VJJ98_07765 [Sedimentisphaerales bacterium]|nr:hypothetical protein [Sedimentisphaerales bacterium]